MAKSTLEMVHVNHVPQVLGATACQALLRQEEHRAQRASTALVGPTTSKFALLIRIQPQA